eukprot:m.140810 g.140810  ORF g.140810 m.140810 type:complete len:663 (-) comp17095_c0_seq1:178-2166(-)
MPWLSTSALVLLTVLMCFGVVGDHVGSVSNQQPEQCQRHEQGCSVSGVGYLVYVPAMGRFGNQVDQLLGTLALAKALNRTLVLPPFVDYSPLPTFTPFDAVFDVAHVLASGFSVVPLQQAAAVLAARSAAATVYCEHGFQGGWQQGQRAHRLPLETCRQALAGVPQQAFWNHHNISFADAAFHPGIFGPTISVAAEWATALPVCDHPVVFLGRAPAMYPLPRELEPLQQVLRWHQRLTVRAAELMQGNGPPSIAVHVRGGSDWACVCHRSVGQREIMATPQCHLPTGRVQLDTCLPSPAATARAVAAHLTKASASHNKHVYIGTDCPSCASGLRHHLEKTIKGVVVTVGTPLIDGDAAFLDLIAFESALSFVGNCASSFSAFARRARAILGKPTSFVDHEARSEVNTGAAAEHPANPLLVDSVVVTSAHGLAALDTTEYILGDLILEFCGGATGPLSLNGVKRVGGRVVVGAGCGEAKEIAFGQLQAIGGELVLEDLDGTTAVLLPALTWVGGDVRMTHCGAVAQLELGALAEVGGALLISDCHALQAFALPLLVSVGSHMTLLNNPMLRRAVAPQLATVRGFLEVYRCQQLQHLGLPHLSHVHGAVFLAYCHLPAMPPWLLADTLTVSPDQAFQFQIDILGCLSDCSSANIPAKAKLIQCR